MDSMGHVNNAKYLTYMESARIQLFAEVGLKGPMTPERHGFSLAAISCNYRREVKYPAQLELGTCVRKIGSSSFHLAHGFYFPGDDVVVADATAVVVWADYNVGRGIPIPPGLRGALERFLVQD